MFQAQMLGKVMNQLTTKNHDSKFQKVSHQKKFPIIFILICSYNNFNYLLFMSD